MRTYHCATLPAGYTVTLRQRAAYSGAQLVAVQCLAMHNPNATGRIAWARAAYRYALRAHPAAAKVYPAAYLPWVMRYSGLVHYARYCVETKRVQLAALLCVACA